MMDSKAVGEVVRAVQRASGHMLGGSALRGLQQLASEHGILVGEVDKLRLESAEAVKLRAENALQSQRIAQLVREASVAAKEAVEKFKREQREESERALSEVAAAVAGPKLEPAGGPSGAAS